MPNQDGRSYPAGRPRGSNEYYHCHKCGGDSGFFFRRREPTDTFNDPAVCPNCGTSSNEFPVDDKGVQLRWPHNNAPLFHIKRLTGHSEIAFWKRGYFNQERKLPNKAPVGQYFKVSFRLMQLYSGQLTHLDLHLLLLLLLYQDNRPGSDGWTPPLSQQTLGVYAQPPGRSTPMRRETINESIYRLHRLIVDVWNPVKQTFEKKPLLDIIESHPKRFKVNMP